MIQGSTVFDDQAATDLQNHINLKLNEKALKTSKDITVTNNMSKKQIFDMINANDEDHSLSEREVYKVDKGNNLMIRDEKEAGQVD